jgi:antitoxin component HigA of HigAB toxin-antitoxin module
MKHVFPLVENTYHVAPIVQQWYDRTMKTAARKLKQKVQAHMDKTGCTKKKVAASLEISPEQLAHLLAGRRCATIRQAIRIKREFDIPIEDWDDESARYS